MYLGPQKTRVSSTMQNQIIGNFSCRMLGWGDQGNSVIWGSSVFALFILITFRNPFLNGTFKTRISDTQSVPS